MDRQEGYVMYLFPVLLSIVGGLMVVLCYRSIPRVSAAPPPLVTKTKNWPFDQSRKAAAFSLKSIVFDDAPILHVTHDSDDHGWQFLSLDDADIKQAAIVTMEEIVAIDASVIEVADLPPGWRAWRSSISSPWQRAPKNDVKDEVEKMKN